MANHVLDNELFALSIALRRLAKRARQRRQSKKSLWFWVGLIIAVVAPIGIGAFVTFAELGLEFRDTVWDMLSQSARRAMAAFSSSR